MNNKRASAFKIGNYIHILGPSNRRGLRTSLMLNPKEAKFVLSDLSAIAGSVRTKPRKQPRKA